MSSFFEKLKGSAKEKVLVEEKPKEKAKKIEKIKTEEKPSFAKGTSTELGRSPTEGKKEWFEPEGQLAIDVYQTEFDIVIQAPIAGVKKEDLDISIENDVVTIRGNRQKPEEVEEKNYFSQECYWGPFSRQIILPVEGDPSRAEALMKEGILTLRIPRIEREKKRKIAVKE